MEPILNHCSLPLKDSKMTIPESNYKIHQILSWKICFKSWIYWHQDHFIVSGYSCALVGDILLQGHLYITHNYFAFYSNVFGYVTKVRSFSVGRQVFYDKKTDFKLSTLVVNPSLRN